eukprot:930039-Pyramimonas_sp.AAC.1
MLRACDALLRPGGHAGSRLDVHLRVPSHRPSASYTGLDTVTVDLITPPYHSKIRLSRHFLTDAICPRPSPTASPVVSATRRYYQKMFHRGTKVSSCTNLSVPGHSPAHLLYTDAAGVPPGTPEAAQRGETR